MELYFNGVKVESEEELEGLLNDWESFMVEAEQQIRNEYDVSAETASAILYLRGRSRWTHEKEIELVRRDKEGNPISLDVVLSGEF